MGNGWWDKAGSDAVLHWACFWQPSSSPKALVLFLALYSGSSDDISIYVVLSSSFTTVLLAYLCFCLLHIPVFSAQSLVTTNWALFLVFLQPELTWLHLCSEQGCVLIDIPCLHFIPLLSFSGACFSHWLLGFALETGSYSSACVFAALV